MQLLAFIFIGLISIFSHSLCGHDISSTPEDLLWEKEEKFQKSLFKVHDDQQIKSWQDYVNRVKLKWADGSVSEQKVYVEYFSNDDERIKIDFESRKLVVEILAEPQTVVEPIKNKIQNIVDKFIESSKNSKLIELDEISNKIVDVNKIKSSSNVGGDGKNRPVYGFEIDFVPDFVIKRVKKIKPIVDAWSAKYQLDSSYILAIIRQESAFNPKARSWVPALGLMQIVPKYAGLEVMQVVTGKSIKPDENFLFDPEKNIMVGTTYLHLLRDKYFPQVNNKDKQIILMTASYNWGPHRIQKAIKDKKILPSANSKETYDIIQKIAPSETKNYVTKVLKFYNEFKELGF
jgi:membrane-bound lytic murein transglycosylase C